MRLAQKTLEFYCGNWPREPGDLKHAISPPSKRARASQEALFGRLALTGLIQGPKAPESSARRNFDERQVESLL